MKTTTLLLWALAFGFALPAPKAEDNFTLVKVTDGVYAAVTKPGGLASGNAGFIVGDDGVLMVDTFFTPAAVEDLIGVIATETKQPLKYALNTHYHLQAIADGLTIDQAKQQLKLPEKYRDFAFQNFAVANVEDMYKELKGTKF